MIPVRAKMAALGTLVAAFLPLVTLADSSCAFTPINETNDTGYGYTTVYKVAQKFQVSSACTPTDLAAKVKTSGTPGDHTIYRITSDSGAVPGTVLGSTSVISGLTGTFAWATSTMTTSINLVSATDYWFVVDTDNGQNSGTDFYYAFLSDNTVLTYGGFFYWNGSSWGSGGGHAVLFQIYGSSGGGGGGSIATSTPLDLTQQEFLFIFGLATFLFSIPFWDRVFTITRGRYDL